MPNPYEILEVHPRAQVRVVTAAYLALREGADPARLGELADAHKILTDQNERAALDKANAPVTGTLIGNHRILSKIAEGGFGTTYRGEHVITRESVCIKHCSSISVAHDEVLIQEAQALGQLRHFSLPAMRDIHRLEDGSLALVMSFIPHPTIEQIVEKVGRIDAETTMWVTERLVNALLFTHRYGVIHGDIKPQNVLVNPEGHEVFIVDFGLAQIKPTTSTKAKGYTKFFAPPEQIESAERDVRKPLIPESDFYSLGKLMTYMLGGGLDAVKKNHVPSDVPDAVCQFIRRVTAKNPLDRLNVPKSSLDKPQDNLVEEVREIRMKAFKRARSGMKRIEGL